MVSKILNFLLLASILFPICAQQSLVEEQDQCVEPPKIDQCLPKDLPKNEKNGDLRTLLQSIILSSDDGACAVCKIPVLQKYHKYAHMRSSKYRSTPVIGKPNIPKINSLLKSKDIHNLLEIVSKGTQRIQQEGMTSPKNIRDLLKLAAKGTNKKNKEPENMEELLALVESNEIRTGDGSTLPYYNLKDYKLDIPEPTIGEILEESASVFIEAKSAFEKVGKKWGTKGIPALANIAKSTAKQGLFTAAFLEASQYTVDYYWEGKEFSGTALAVDIGVSTASGVITSTAGGMTYLAVGAVTGGPIGIVGAGLIFGVSITTSYLLEEFYFEDMRNDLKNDLKGQLKTNLENSPPVCSGRGTILGDQIPQNGCEEFEFTGDTEE